MYCTIITYQMQICKKFDEKIFGPVVILIYNQLVGYNVNFNLENCMQILCGSLNDLYIYMLLRHNLGRHHAWKNFQQIYNLKNFF